MLSVAILLWTLLASSCVALTQGCPVTWFGAGCRYKCRCTNGCPPCVGRNCSCSQDNCDVNGECQNGAKCQVGWFGPACQYADLALNTTTVATQLTDGDDTTCLPDSSSFTSVNLTWTQPFIFTWLRVHVNNPALLYSFRVQFTSDTNQQTDCVIPRNSTVSGTNLDIYCNLTSHVKGVTLTGAGVKSLCSVYISGGRNVALGKSPTQSSTYPNADATYAVDGNTSGNFTVGSCTHTEPYTSLPYPWWRLVFSRTKLITRILLYNRKDFQERLQGFDLTAGSASGAVNYTDPNKQPQDMYTVILESQATLVSNITIEAPTGILTLCEVEIYGETDCLQGQYGSDCERQCNCDGECFVSTGGCPNGCPAGYQGDTCNDTCSDTFFGPNCKWNCSSNCTNEKCDKFNGNCDRCIVGKSGDFCDQDCAHLTFGEDCSNNCSKNCSGDGACHTETGACSHGCLSGLEGVTCDQPCSDKFFGPNCKWKCSSNCTNDTCDRFNGTCDRCIVGKLGDFCDQDCPHLTFGDDCNNSCSKNCSGDGACHPVTGACSHGCLAGLEGLTCDQPCSDRFFGPNCDEKCSSSCTNETCDRFNGTCERCIVGKKGDFCDQEVENVSDPSNVGPIVGAVVAFIVVVILVIIGVVCWRRRRYSKPAGLSSTNSQDSVGGSSQGINNNFSAGVEMKPVKPVPGPKPLALKSQTDDAPSSQKTYYNSASLQDTSHRIALKDLDDFMSSHDKQFFQDQFANIPANAEATMVEGLSSKNKDKNRYKNVCAYDHSRVNLLANKSKTHGDYINASYVEGYNAEEKFIAAQGPTKTILEDFVRMLWEQEVEKVVMLTNLIEEGKHKCERYWPEDGEMKVGEITVKLTTTQVFADYTIRRLHLSKTGEPAQTLTHFHFTSWPDKDVPTGPWGLVDFEQKVASCPTSKPIVVHCSAGVGRTGTFIALRNVVKQAQATGYLDFFTTVEKLRHDRINMVQTPAQYEFLHRSAQVAMLCLGTTVTSSDIKDRIKNLSLTSESGLSNLDLEFRAVSSICNTSTDDLSSEDTTEESTYHVYENSRRFANRAKNRLSNILPKELYRVHLRFEVDETEDYINAVFVPSCTRPRQQILTQLPLPTTVTDFWRLVTQQKVSLIVAFEADLKETDKTIGTYLPPSDGEVLLSGHLDIKTESVKSDSLWVQKKVTVTADTNRIDNKSSLNNFQGELRVNHLSCTRTDLDPESMLDVVTQVRSLAPVGEGRVLYMCRNGADFSGLVCILSLLLDRMDSDHCLTVPLVVGAIKAIRPQVIPTLKQYKLLYDVLSTYHDSINVYTNCGSSLS